MLFWIVLGLLTVIASLAVILPLAAGRGDVAPARDHDIEVYRDQLAEIERDAERGLIGADEAAEARAEIGRRILRLNTGAGPDKARRDTAFSRGLAMAAVLAVPLVSWGVYNGIGSPEMPGQPLAARLEKAPAQSSIDELVARAENHLRANPDDGRGWDVLAPIYLRLNRPGESATAYRNAARLLPPSAARESGLGEALTVASGGVVTAEAADAFRRALDLDRGDVKAQFFLATALAQEGRRAEANAALRAAAAGLAEESPWRPVLREAIAQTEAAAEPVQRAGPSQDDVDAAASMSSEDRTAMIEGMVARLDERLRENPADAEGWRRLVRSYAVLGRKDEAGQALDRGIAALGADSDAGRELAAFAATLGIGKVE